jgi:hypothetical protein
LELAKQVNQAGTASATAQLQAANVVSQGGIQDTACSNTGAQTRLDQSVAAGTSWFEYLGALSYGLLPRILVGAVCIFLIVEGVRMSGKSRK